MVECIKLLLENGADPNDKVGDDFYQKYRPISPLFLAVREGTPEIVELLLDHGADPEDHAKGFTTLYQVEPDAPVNQIKLETTTTIAIERALIYRLDIADVLLRRGGDPNRRRNNIGATLLHLVAATPEIGVEAIKLLLARGADPTIRTKSAPRPMTSPFRCKTRPPPPRFEARPNADCALAGGYGWIASLVAGEA